MSFRVGSIFVIAAGFTLALAGCPKTPLRENRAEFDVSASHWFANEKTQYVFFSVRGLRPSQAKLGWPLGFEISAPGGQVGDLKAGPDGFAALDFSKGVHRHRLVECGEGRVCGSFSFHSEAPVQRLNVRFRYNTAGAMNELASIPVAVHPEGQGADSQSALVYGVYDKDNTHLQVRVHDNFGTPDSQAVAAFGMERTFKISGLSAAPLSLGDEMNMRASSGSAFLFPAVACAGRAAGTASAWQFSGHESWARSTFDPAEAQSDACFTVDALDRQGKLLNSAPAVARKNPVFTDQPLTIHPPLKKTIQIPVVLSYCLDAPGAGDLTSADFLRYQYFILGVDPKAKIDPCFTIGGEDKFAQDLERVLDQKLQAARAHAGADRDFFFNVVINHRLAPEVRKFHQIIAEKLRQKIGSEILMVSPRLVGAFVYDSRPAPDVDAGANVTWCPKPEKPQGGMDDPDANCTPRDAGNVSLGPFNFLIPMGPFPTLEKFVKYHNDYGDRGETTDPQFSVSSVQTNGNSVTDQVDGRFFTFFDGERLSLSGSEHLKFCRDRDNGSLLDQLAFRQVDSSGNISVLDTNSAQNLVLSNTQGASMLVGLWWDSPYVGTFSFNSPVRGKILSVIPISATLSNKQKLGDPRWSLPVWNLTPLMQKCVRHCTHPYFDEAGSYQVDVGWHEVPQCPEPRTPEYMP